MSVEMASIAPLPVPEKVLQEQPAPPRAGGAGPERASCAWRASYLLTMYPCAIASGLLLVFFLLCVPARDAGSKMANSNNNDWTVVSAPTNDNDMWNDARTRTAPADPDRVVKARSQMSTVWGAVNYLYSWGAGAADPDADIFTAENVQEMCELERIFIGRAGYEDFCILDYSDGANTSSTCAPVRMSASRLFYAAMFVNQTMDCSHMPVCNAQVKAGMAAAIEAQLPVPTTYINPATPDTKYWVTSMPGTPSSLFNFTDTQGGGAARPGRREDGDPLGKGYALGGKGACPLLPDWHVKAVREWLYTTVALPSVMIGPLNTTGEQVRRTTYGVAVVLPLLF
jgi:hypothetical protein